jgi:hypothetical protein
MPGGWCWLDVVVVLICLWLAKYLGTLARIEHEPPGD